MQQPDIQRLLELQQLLAAFNQVDRVVHRRHNSSFVRENDTEHSYNLAMTAWYLSQYFPKLDRDELIRFALVHDLVEVHAGDTYVYGTPEELDSKQQREHDALQRLKAEWSDFPGLTEAIDLYEQRESEEAKFVYALDKIMPMMQIYIHDGYTWKQEHITPQKLDAIKRTKVALSPEIDSYYQQLYDLLLHNRQLFEA